MKFKTRAIGFKRYQSERNACVQCGFPFFTLIQHTKNIWIPLPWSGKQTVNNSDCSGTKELPQSCTTPYGGPIPFLECVLFFKTKTPDVRLKVAQKRMAQEWKAHIQHWSERAAYRKANTTEKLPLAHVKDSDASSIRNTYFWKLHKSCSSIHSTYIWKMPAIRERVYQACLKTRPLPHSSVGTRKYCIVWTLRCLGSCEK